MMKLLQDQQEEHNDVQMRINHLIEVQELRQEVFQGKMKNVFDKKTKLRIFELVI